MGLLRLHRTLAYVVFLVALVDLALVLAKGRTDPRVAAVVDWSHKVGIRWIGRVTLLAGLSVWILSDRFSIGTWWIWVSLLLWGPVEAIGARWMDPEIRVACDGGHASGRIITGATIQLLCIMTIFGLMSARS